MKKNALEIEPKAEYEYIYINNINDEINKKREELQRYYF
jgi:hypothetical protein